MAKQLNPTPGVLDELGSTQKPWAKIVAQLIQNAAGVKVLFEGFDASKIGTGFLSPSLINKINKGTIVPDYTGTPTIQSVIDAATLGATDPVARINAGPGGLDGEKVADGTLDLSAINPVEALANLLLVTGSGGWQSDDYDGSSPLGFKLTKTDIQFLLATAVFGGILKGQIQIGGKFLVDNQGNAIWNDPANGQIGFNISEDGHVFVGGDAYPDATLQIDPWGNFYLNDTPQSLSRIDLGAIDATCKAVQPSQAGGQFSGNITLTPLTRGAQIYYTTNGTDPTLVTNGARTLYTGPIPINTSGGPVTLKAAAFKLGIYGPIGSWTYTASASATADPTFNPIAGFYTTPNTTFPVALASGTPGATIKFTTDGSTPGPSNGTIYTAPIAVPRSSSASTTIKAYATKAGLTDSNVVTGIFTIRKGANTGGGGGGNPGDQ